MTKSLTNPDREFYESTWNTAILKHQAPIVRRLDNAIHWIKLYPVDNAIRFAIRIAIYLLDSVIRISYNWAQQDILFTPNNKSSLIIGNVKP